MKTIVLSVHEDGHQIRLQEIHCNDVLRGLAVLHERLNAVAMPRVYQEDPFRSTAGLDDKVANLWPQDDHPVCISC